MIVVAERLIPGDGLIQPRRFVWFLIVDRVGSDMRAGAGPDDFAVQDIDIPPCFVVLSAVTGVAQREAPTGKVGCRRCR
jgi:hypothetical protein